MSGEKKVVRISKDLKTKIYPSAAEAGRKNKCSPCNIRTICNKGKYLKTSGGFFWMWKKEYDTRNGNVYFPKSATGKISDCLEIVRVTKSLEVTIYPSMEDAARLTGIGRGAIYMALKRRHFARGYNWFRKDHWDRIKKDFRFIRTQKFTKEDDQILISRFRDHSDIRIAKSLNRTPASIKTRRAFLGLKRTHEEAMRVMVAGRRYKTVSIPDKEKERILNLFGINLYQYYDFSEFLEDFPTNYLLEARLAKRLSCHNCGGDRLTNQKRDGTWKKCLDCKQHITWRTGTPLYDTRIKPITLMSILYYWLVEGVGNVAAIVRKVGISKTSIRRTIQVLSDYAKTNV